jgi:molybdopterin-biosynthesis enzyme MoeA-like protein
LGPTFDDLTNEALGQATGREMIEYSVSGSLLPHV